MKINAEKYKQGEILKFMRQCKGLTQKEFSESIGKKEAWARNIEQGLSNLYFKDILKIAKKYNFKIIIENEE